MLRTMKELPKVHAGHLPRVLPIILSSPGLPHLLLWRLESTTHRRNLHTKLLCSISLIHVGCTSVNPKMVLFQTLPRLLPTTRAWPFVALAFEASGFWAVGWILEALRKGDTSACPSPRFFVLQSLLPLPAPRGPLNPPSLLPFPSPPKLLYHARALLASSFLLYVLRATTPHPAPHHHLSHKGAREEEDEEGYCVGGALVLPLSLHRDVVRYAFPFRFSPSRLRFYFSLFLSLSLSLKL